MKINMDMKFLLDIEFERIDGKNNKSANMKDWDCELIIDKNGAWGGVLSKKYYNGRVTIIEFERFEANHGDVHIFYAKGKKALKALKKHLRNTDEAKIFKKHNSKIGVERLSNLSETTLNSYHFLGYIDKKYIELIYGEMNLCDLYTKKMEGFSTYANLSFMVCYEPEHEAQYLDAHLYYHDYYRDLPERLCMCMLYEKLRKTSCHTLLDINIFKIIDEFRMKYPSTKLQIESLRKEREAVMLI